MKRRASKRKTEKRQTVSNRVVRSGATLVAQNPILVGGITAFLLTLFFVSANALWYQPHGHPAAIFPTRALVFDVSKDFGSRLPLTVSEELETTIRIERETVAPVPADPVVEKVQSVLSDLNFYTGSVDGIAGPKTNDAIRNYRRIMGMEPTEGIDEALLSELGAKSSENTDATPVPVLRHDGNQSENEETAVKSARGSLVVRIQAGLRAFGNHHVEIDGITGPQTRDAIREFQVLFGLEPTGDATEAVLTKMRALGLTG